MSLNPKTILAPSLSAMVFCLIAGMANASSGNGFEFGDIGVPVCAQLCDPDAGAECTNSCMDSANVERKFRENSVYSHPGKIQFQPHARKGISLELKISSGSTNLCTQTNANLTHALVDNASRRIIVRFAHGERGDFCPALFVEREFGVQLTVVPDSSGDYEIVSETPATVHSRGGARSHGKVRIQE